MTPIPDYKPNREAEAYEGARKIHETVAAALILAALFIGLGGLALIGDELQTLRNNCGAVEAFGVGR